MRTLMLAMLAMVIGLNLSARGDAAQLPLADRVPGDATVYIGWAGTDALSTKYDASHLRKVIDASDMPKLFTEFVPQLIRWVAKQDQSSAEVVKQVVEIGAPLWKHPTAFYFGGIDWNGPQPTPRLAVLCDAGDDASALAERISKLMEQAPQGQFPLPMVKTYGTLVVLAFGSAASIDADFAQSPAENITNATKFTSSLNQVQHDPAYVEYVDVDSAVKLVDDGLQRVNDANTTQRWQQARDALGLTGLHSMIVTAGFAGPDWSTQAFISSSEGNQGILSLLHGTPLSKEILSAVPQSADRMAAGKFDLDSFLGQVRDIVAQLSPEMGDQIDQNLANINQAAGLDLRKDLLANLGDEWAFYSDRKTAGPGILGSVIVNRLKDADAFNKSIVQLAHRANQVIAGLINKPEISIQFRKSESNGVTLYFLAVPFVTPCWAVQDGNLYLGLYPQVVSAAVDQVARHAPSILQRPEYIAVMKQLGDHDASSVGFSNLPATAPDGYTDMLAISRLYLGMADLFGVPAPVMVIPPLGKIMSELSPSGSVVWNDAAGMHAKSVSPFPGSDLVAGTSIGSGAFIAEDGLLISILLPSLNKARETANRAKCASNEHQIGLGLLLYSNDNNGKLPDDLGTLVKTEQLTPSVFVCPAANTSVPANIGTMTPDDQAKWVNENSDYVYLGKGLIENQVPADRIVLYEKAADHAGDGMNLLYGDGHADWQKMDVAQRLIQQQAGK